MSVRSAVQKLLCTPQLTQEAQLMLTNPHDAFRGQSRSPNIIPFHVVGIHSSCAIVTLSSRVKTCRFSDIRLHKMSWPWNPRQRSLKVIERGAIDCVWFPISYLRAIETLSLRFWDIRLQKCRDLQNLVRSVNFIGNVTVRYNFTAYNFLLMFYSNYGSLLCRFWDIQCRKMSWPWNPGHRSLKVIRTDTDRSATYDFLLALHINHERISYRFRDKWRFQSQIANFSHPRVFNAPAEGILLEIRYRCNVSKTRMIGLPYGRKKI